MSQTSKTIVTVVITAIIVGGGFYFWQQNKNVNVDAPQVAAPEAKTPEAKKVETGNLPTGIEWLTYEDKDISFVYPKTFLGTPLKEASDKDMLAKTWQVTRGGDTIYIRPNFESPAAEFGSTYEITIYKNKKAFWKLYTQLTDGATPKNGCSPTAMKDITGPLHYTLCSLERELDVETYGPRTGQYYFLLADSKYSALANISVFDMSGGMYTNYVRSTLISSIKVK